MTHVHVLRATLRNTHATPGATDATTGPSSTKREEDPVAPGGQSRVVSIFLPGKPTSPNVSSKQQHWGARSQDRSVWRTAAKFAALEAMGRKAVTFDRVDIELVMVGQRLDPDNAVAACKPLIDGIVDSGLIADDSFRVIGSLRVTSEAGPTTGVRIEVFERPLPVAAITEGRTA